MCGIAGVLHAEGSRAIAAVKAMNQAEAHRGPDDEGLAVIPVADGALVLGHKRLAIIDLSPAGHQPMRDTDNDNWLTFNGEIYNFRDLRQTLEKMGCAFRTRTDTEVILKAYAAWGEECVKRFRGIFAFAIWDNHQKKLFIARDQLGVKPVYSYHTHNCFVFASEVRAILASGLVPRHTDRSGLYSYLAYGSVQEPYTLVEGVRSVLPGHTLEWKNGNVHSHRYWQLPPPEAVGIAHGANLYELVAEKLTDAVGAQLISDVPLGAFLSGGIDSAVIAALMRRTSNGNVKTFSIVFEESEYDERVYSRRAAQHIGTDHKELELNGEMVRSNLQNALDAYDQPSVDGLNTYFVSKVTKEAGLTVALSGVGGDELFGGYEGYRKSLTAERWGRLVQGLAPFVPSCAASMLQKFRGPEALRKAAGLLTTNRHPYFTSRRLFSDHQIGMLLAQDLRCCNSWEPVTFERIEQETKNYDPINRASACELQTYMLSTLLRDTDQMSMAHALEVRVPLIDHKLVELLFTLPGSCKVNSKLPKPLLTRSLGDAIPEECIYRPKRGFELPFSLWFRGSLQQEIKNLFERQQELWPLSQDGLRPLWSQYTKGRVSWSRVWAVFVLRHWLAGQNLS